MCTFMLTTKLLKNIMTFSDIFVYIFLTGVLVLDEEKQVAVAMSK